MSRSELNWYAFVVPAQKEYVAAHLLEKIGAETYVPTETRWRRRNRYAKRKEEFPFPVAPRYVFAGFSGAAPWHKIFAISVVRAVVIFDGVAKTIDPARMERFRRRIPNGRLSIQTVQVKARGQSSNKGTKHKIITEAHAPAEQQYMQSGKEFAAGDRVSVIDGPFRDRTVSVLEIKGATATLLLSLFGCDREIDVPLHQLELAS